MKCLKVSSRSSLRMFYAHGGERARGVVLQRKSIMKQLLLCLLVTCLLATGCAAPESRGEGASAALESCAPGEPDNPYAEGSGHFAGFEWAERNSVGSCGGNSQSFIEGCEEYLRQSGVDEACPEAP